MNSSSMPKPRVVVVCGPTGIGKTRLSMALANRFNGGIVSADSMQIYRHMNIGTAKPDAAKQAAAPHYMIDVADPDEAYDAARYAREAQEAVANLKQQGRLPLIIGGTGLYIKALLYGLFDAAPSSPRLREKLRNEAAQKGTRILHERLAACDAKAAGRIHPNDAHRIIRALEVHALTGRPISEYQHDHGFANAHYCFLKIGLYMDRQALYAQINQRVEQMVAEGLLREVRSLQEMGYDPELKSMQSLGYRHMTAYLQGCLDWNEAIDQMKKDTRRYAKRQLVWFRKDPDVFWMGPDSVEEACRRVRAFLKQPE
ncbi:tRNA dimethylallyltransferase [Desulfosalsimonas propionicica]|uniref:tRNA dimethylallyltransferase n=1 Tax=Desulfosalsimonas propionicica TaxID=332175 RepID=A0A7W0C939_9BACT|nr:tRNA (adenosine(37)-N6)-dimethylallyltransferase MiaA [Desulfosalsimonas propionicica]MBA2881397.1 tRNA dimethylallyltransferase [Desulfosalsimonas propionicica]